MGQANVYQEDLDSFLAIAEEIRLKGLTGQTSNELLEDQEEPKHSEPTKMCAESLSASNIDKTERIPDNALTKSFRIVAIPNHSGPTLQALDEMVKSMMEKSESKHASGHQKADRCKVCGKEGMGSAIKDHIEANHIEGIVIPCNLCEKTFRSRNALKLHKRSYHIRLS